MSVFEFVLSIAVGLPVTIVGMVLFYRYMVLRHEAKYPKNGSQQAPGGESSVTLDELDQRAQQLVRRVQNLEDILLEEKFDKK